MCGVSGVHIIACLMLPNLGVASTESQAVQRKCSMHQDLFKRFTTVRCNISDNNVHVMIWTHCALAQSNSLPLCIHYSYI